jgi:hypothetical protein
MVIGKLYKALEVKSLNLYENAEFDMFSSKLVGYLNTTDCFVLLKVFNVSIITRPAIDRRALILTKDGKTAWINLRKGEEIGVEHESISKRERSDSDENGSINH